MHHHHLKLVSTAAPSSKSIYTHSVFSFLSASSHLKNPLIQQQKQQQYSTRAHWYRQLHTTKDKSIFSTRYEDLKRQIAEDISESEDVADLLIKSDPNWKDSEFRKWFVREVVLQSAGVDNDPKKLLESISSLTTFKRDFGLQRLMTTYKDSLLKMFEEVFPEDADWIKVIPLKLLRPEEIEERITEVADAVAQKLMIRTNKDWGNVSTKEFAEIGMKNLNDKEYRLQFLRKAYPDEQWDARIFDRPVRASHRRLVAAVMDTFPGLRLREETHLKLSIDSEEILIDTDIYIEDLKLAFDYRGPQHFHDTRGAFMQVEGAMRKDQLKRNVFEQNGIQLIEIPYWWDETVDQFQATVHNVRADLVPSTPQGVEPIPEFPPEKRSTSLYLMEPEFWDNKQDLSEYHVTEKLDGIRCTIEKGILYNRKKNEMFLPQQLQDQLNAAIAGMGEDVVFDAELVCSQSFEKLNALLTRSKQDHFREADWEDVRLCLFDIVDENKTIEDRIEMLQQVHEQDKVSVLKHERLRDNDHARSMLNEIVAKGGEGLVCIRPGSPYFIGRTRSMIKIKPYYDQEVLFLGKADKSISFDVELLNGQKMKARTTWGDYRRTDLVPGETVLTICYTQLHQSTGKPFQPTVLRERRDMTWDELKQKREETGSDHTLLQSSMVDAFRAKFEELGLNPKEMNAVEKQDMFNNHFPSNDFYPSSEEKEALAEIFGLTVEEVAQNLSRMRTYRRKALQVEEEKKEEQV
eukprot:CAMPEP_0117441186 /NCGR_PEP_ID=MMETSP0759-20121206/3502_1 /TAXON_ID=63605 /ORGANISM="Percolomonas cosmopolitus, Strain WS" /LENGTH=745 /DNA_ID=CAMNT_0005233027 /DNA_START=59 /DNA_END=2296 /DNA_ORIENTATION=-